MTQVSVLDPRRDSSGGYKRGLWVAMITGLLPSDYAAMADMFMEDPPAFEEMLAGLADLEGRINKMAALDGPATASAGQS